MAATFAPRKPMNEEKLHPLVRQRYSPRSYSPLTISEDDMQLLLEAARLAPSSSNIQPWRFVYAHRGSEVFNNMVEGLMPANQIWAAKAAVLLFTACNDMMPSGDKPNTYAQHDTATATAWLNMQAMHMGMFLRYMGGYDKNKMREITQLPENHTPLAVVAIGYLGNPANLPEDIAKPDLKPRTRKQMEEIAAMHSFQNLQQPLAK